MKIKLFQKYLCPNNKRKNRHYRQIKFSKPKSPDENTKKLLKIITQDFEFIRSRKKEDHERFGIFFAVILLIERTLERLTIGFHPGIADCMFNDKIIIYKDFLKALKQIDPNFDISFYREFVEPLHELRKIRNNMAHHLNIWAFEQKEIKNLEKMLFKYNESLTYGLSEGKGTEDENLRKVLGFGFLFCEKVAFVINELE